MELISKDDLLDDISARLKRIPVYMNAEVPIKEIAAAIKTAPTIESRPTGKLIEEWDGYRCSSCKIGFSEEIRFLNYKMGMPNYCPNCGAQMEGE